MAKLQCAYCYMFCGVRVRPYLHTDYMPHMIARHGACGSICPHIHMHSCLYATSARSHPGLPHDALHRTSIHVCSVSVFSPGSLRIAECYPFAFLRIAADMPNRKWAGHVRSISTYRIHTVYGTYKLQACMN